MSSFGLEMLSADECAELLRTHWFGRVAVWSGDHPAVLPVLYGLLDGDVVFRTAPGEKLIAAVLGNEAVFEIDAVEPVTHTGWSVNVLGTLEEIQGQEDLERADALGLAPWAGEFRDRFVRLRTTRLSGRRIASHGPSVMLAP